MQKNLFIRTYGCQMNVYDSIRIGDVLKPFGYQITETIENAEQSYEIAKCKGHNPDFPCNLAKVVTVDG